MARSKKRRPLRPRVPSRVKKRTKRTRSHHENELIGLALAALGLVLSAILYLGFDGGAVGSWLADALTAGHGRGAYVLPLALLAIGGLMLARSDLLEVRPFRLGVGVGFLGLMTLLGKDSGGWIGLALGGTLAAPDRRDGRSDRRRRAAARRRAARERRVDRRDPAPDRSRRSERRVRCATRARLGLERVADRRDGHPAPGAGGASEAPARRRGGVPGRRRRACVRGAPPARPRRARA